jgi:hypothetical protein
MSSRIPGVRVPQIEYHCPISYNGLCAEFRTVASWYYECYVWCGSTGAQTAPGTLSRRHAGADGYQSRLISLYQSSLWAGTTQFRKRLCWSFIKGFWHRKCDLKSAFLLQKFFTPTDAPLKPLFIVALLKIFKIVPLHVFRSSDHQGFSFLKATVASVT